MKTIWILLLSLFSISSFASKSERISDIESRIQSLERKLSALKGEKFIPTPKPIASPQNFKPFAVAVTPSNVSPSPLRIRWWLLRFCAYIDRKTNARQPRTHDTLSMKLNPFSMPLLPPHGPRCRLFSCARATRPPPP